MRRQRAPEKRALPPGKRGYWTVGFLLDYGALRVVLQPISIVRGYL